MARCRGGAEGELGARGAIDAAATVDAAIAERIARVAARPDRSRLVFAAAERLAAASVCAVAGELEMSERNFRRVFREAVGVSPKAFAKLARFHRALSATRENSNWASPAAGAGYCDQAHLIAEFGAITE